MAEKKEEFKNFVKKHPELIRFVKKGDMTWQNFYEIYDLYGEESDGWKGYLNSKVAEETIAKTSAGFGTKELISWLKGINLDSLQNGVDSLQRVVGLLSDLGGSKDNSIPKTDEYKPRPIYKHFED